MALEETHTSLPLLGFFRSPQPGRSWVTAAVIILESIALILSGTKTKPDRYMNLCFKAGCLSLNRIARYFREHAHTRVSPMRNGQNPVQSPDKDSYLAALTRFQEAGIFVTDNQEQAWEKYLSFMSASRKRPATWPSSRFLPTCAR